MLLTSQIAYTALSVGNAKVDELQEPSCLAVVDAGGHLIAFLRTHNAAFGVADLAINKAYTASALKVATSELYTGAQPGGEIFGITHAAGRPFVVFGGGLPIVHQGNVIGAVGVSGGPVSADLEIAGAMLSSIHSSLDA